MKNELQPLRKWAKDAAQGKTGKIPYIDITNLIDEVIELRAKVESLAADAERLDFLAQNEAWIAWSKDGESCRVFVRNEDGEHLPMMGWVPEAWAHSAREAIDTAKEKA